MDWNRLMATTMGAALLFAAMVDYFYHNTPWVYVGAGIGAIGGFWLSWSSQRKNPVCPSCGRPKEIPESREPSPNQSV